MKLDGENLRLLNYCMQFSHETSWQLFRWSKGFCWFHDIKLWWSFAWEVSSWAEIKNQNLWQLSKCKNFQVYFCSKFLHEPCKMRQIRKGVSSAPQLASNTKNIQFPVVQTQLQISCPFTKSEHRLRVKKAKALKPPIPFCPPLIIRTILEHKHYDCHLTFRCCLLLKPQNLSRSAECALWSAPMLPKQNETKKSLWTARGQLYNKEIESTWKTQKSFNCGHITTSDCVSFSLFWFEC